jgi:hypothetical protein
LFVFLLGQAAEAKRIAEDERIAKERAAADAKRAAEAKKQVRRLDSGLFLKNSRK